MHIFPRNYKVSLGLGLDLKLGVSICCGMYVSSVSLCVCIASSEFHWVSIGNGWSGRRLLRPDPEQPIDNLCNSLTLTYLIGFDFEQICQGFGLGLFNAGSLLSKPHDRQTNPAPKP